MPKSTKNAAKLTKITKKPAKIADSPSQNPKGEGDSKPKRPKKPIPEGKAERRLQTIRAISAAITLSGQDVSVSPYGALIKDGPKDPVRRAKALSSFKFFCETYGPQAFRLEWSSYHLRAITKIEEAVRFGTFFAFVMPRGSGKSTLCHWAMIWATFSGLSKYVLYVGATADSAEKRLFNLKRTLRFSDLLLEDFPEIVGPIRHVGGEPRRASGQKWEGVPTGSEWSSRIVLPSIPVSYALAPNSVIDTASIEGEIRGRLYETQTGESVRPDFVVADDPQTRESARSLTLVDYRERILKGDIRYLAGPGGRIGIVVPTTVIYPNDLADRLLDRERNPEYRGERAKMLESLPERMDLWEQYWEIRKQSFRAERMGEEATAFYVENREEMDRGALATWPARFDEGQISAVQYAMDLLLSDSESFYAEGQGEPVVGADEEETRSLKPQEVEDRTIGLKWGGIPEDADKITGFIDISEKVLWWGLIAWRSDGYGVIFKYGAFPEQGLAHFSLATVRKTLTNQARGKSFRSVLIEGLEALVETLAAAEYETEAGEVLSLSGLGIDSGWGEYAVDVYKFCRRSKWRAILKPTKGAGITATKKPLVDPSRKVRARSSVEGQWIFTRTRVGVPLLQFDANLWKSRINQGLRTGKEEPGAIVLTRPAPARSHRMISEQLTAEKGDRVTSSGRTVTQWTCAPGRDNHFLDVAVGAAVIANAVGIKFDLGFSGRRKKGPEAPGDKGPKAQTTKQAQGERAAVAASRRARPESEVLF